MNNLLLYGWNNILSAQKEQSSFKNLLHGRVAITHRTCYDIIAEDGQFQCELTGNMLYGRTPEEYPCTGDWVIFQPIDTDKGLIVDILPRQKTLYRQKNGSVSEKQTIAAHVDKAFIIQSLDMEINIRRIERFIVQMEQEGIAPVLVLTKADLGYNEKEVNTLLTHLSDKIPLFITSVHATEKIQLLKKYIQPAETIVFIGLSGVGKSSLINALCGKEILETSYISNSTGKGRHTSTRREMVLLEGSGVLIDTPGIKLFGVTSGDEESIASVLDISELENSCRFPDCRHINEPGCAVLAAVENGTLDPGIYESYLKLRKEAWHFTASEHEKRKRDKSLSRLVKDVKKYKGYK